jgi:hypothetical protein
VLTLIATLTYSGVRIAKRTRDPFVRYAARPSPPCSRGSRSSTSAAWSGLLPITGITLPLVSFGGSSMLVTLLSIGMLLSFARHEPGAQAALRSRPSALGRLGLGSPAPVPAPRSATEARAAGRTGSRTSSRPRTATRAGAGRAPSRTGSRR